ncbi:MAG: hypothetical protein KBC48_02445 [Candidatus Pacebacteria bacterium]|nr:hypothetical protein [Candidatus Paceibacterota bacterium]
MDAPMEKTEKVFQVVCVSKIGGGNSSSHKWHLDVTGEAKVETIVQEDGGHKFSYTNVVFNGKTYPLVGVTLGLGGSCVSLLVNASDGYECWKLYTDTPADHPDHPMEVNTPEVIRDRAKLHIDPSNAK